MDCAHLSTQNFILLPPDNTPAPKRHNKQNSRKLFNPSVSLTDLVGIETVALSVYNSEKIKPPFNTR